MHISLSHFNFLHEKESSSVEEKFKLEYERPIPNVKKKAGK